MILGSVRINFVFVELATGDGYDDARTNNCGWLASVKMSLVIRSILDEREEEMRIVAEPKRTNLDLTPISEREGIR